METTILGKTGRSVSRIGFGGAPAGLKNYQRAYDPTDPAQRAPVVAAIRRALELGITYFDVAPGYGDGLAEEIFGEGLDGVKPDSIFLATKVSSFQETDVRESLEGSLKRLRRDSVDLLQIHGTVYREEHVDRVMRKGGLLDQMEKLRDEGLVKHLGFTCEAENPALYKFIELGRFDVLQMCYHFLFQHPYDPWWKSGSLYEAEAKEMGICVMRSTTSGLFQKWMKLVHPENTFDYNNALIQFQLSNPLVDVALIGMRSVQRVEENVAIANDMTGRVNLGELFGKYV